MQMTIYTADCVGNGKNCVYPNVCSVDNEADFMAAVEKDHVLAKYKRSYRSKDNYITSDCVVMDCDNDHSEDPEEWVTMQDFADALPDVSMAIAPSRHHMADKDGKSARDRFHVYFPIEPVDDKDRYAELKKEIQIRFPFFDDGALDAARFIFGCSVSEVIWQEGDMTIDSIMHDADEKVIPQGQRNSTMSRFAGRVLVRFGECDKARQVFDDMAAKCDPPLDGDELDSIWNSAIRFYQKVKKQKGYVPPSQYDFKSLKPDDYSDIGQARAIEKEYGNELRHTSATDMLRYDGISWVESKQKAIGAVIEFLDLQLDDAKTQLEAALEAFKKAGIDPADAEAGGKKFIASLTPELQKIYTRYLSAKAYLAFVMKRRDMKYVLSAMQALRPMVDIPVSDLDADPFLLNTPSYTIDIRKGMDGAREHMPEDLITKVTTVDPSDDGKDLWLSALDDFFCYDQELIDYVQQMSALGIIGRVFLEVMIIAYGGGSNGKSTYWNTISKVLGSYCGNMAADALTLGVKRNIQYEMAEAKGKRLLIASELEEGVRLNTSFVKQMASTDEIQAQKKYKDPFHFSPSHTLVLYSNFLPKVSAGDQGTWRRLIVIPFNAKITGKADIKNYSEYLYTHAGGYVLKWLIEGAQKLIANDFKITAPKVVQDAIDKYRGDNDWLGHFLDECTEKDPSYDCKSGELYTEYRMYASRNGEYIRSTTDFYNALESLGFKRRKTKAGNLMVGIRIKPDIFD